ncbi:MAG: ABC transporter substrate-binding protein [Alphaproteobacteria bacterium]|nr:ABC transporter substrate-binding protein [Alphaproteobacteria bacterium]
MKSMRILTILVLALGLAVSSAWAAPNDVPAAAAPAKSAGASTVVKNFYGRLVDVMKQGDQLGFDGRYKKLEPTIKSAFNLPLMTRFAVGLTWSTATPEDQHRLISAFSNFSIATYANRFAAYDGERFDIVGEKPTSGGVIVETRLTPKDSEPVALNYLMKTDEAGNWRIVDVYLDGAISELATRRAEFSSIVKRDGIPALVNSLGEKSKQLGTS